jgi:hypothetical protein
VKWNCEEVGKISTADKELDKGTDDEGDKEDGEKELRWNRTRTAL